MTQPFTAYNPETGEVLYQGTADEPAVLETADTAIVLELAPPDTYRSGDAWAQIPPKPSDRHVFDWSTKTWCDPRTLEQAKAEKRAEINAARLQATYSSFTFQGHEIACDQLSRSDIDGVNGTVATTGALPVDFPGHWKTKANDYVPIPDVATWNGFYAAMVAQGTANFARSQQLKAQVEAATTVEQVDAIPSWM